MHTTLSTRQQAITQINHQPQRTLISLLQSQTIDLYAKQLSPSLTEELNALRKHAADDTKLSVYAIRRLPSAYQVIVDEEHNIQLTIHDDDCGGYQRTLGGGLCNLSRDLEIILNLLSSEGDQALPCTEFLTWSDAANEISGINLDGKSRTSLIFQTPQFEKLILCERGPSYDHHQVNLWQAEQQFYGQQDPGFIFIGQEPLSSEKFAWIRERKLADKNIRVFWLMGGNQLKQLYTEFKHFFPVVDVVSLNLTEAAHFFGFEPLQKKHRDANELRIMYAREISRRTLKYGAKYVVITDGAKGASLARQVRGGRVEFAYSPLIQENRITTDTDAREDTGCGDSFAATIAAYYLQSPDQFRIKEAANFAHLIAGIVYQRPRPYLNDDDLPFVQQALMKARQSNAFVGHHEMFDRNQRQIKPTGIPPRGPARHVLVLVLGGDPNNWQEIDITGAQATIDHLAQQCVDGSYSLAPLVNIIPRYTSAKHAGSQHTLTTISTQDMQNHQQSHRFCKTLGTLPADADQSQQNGVMKADLTGHEGVTILRVSLLETLEILSSEYFAELFGDIKTWHFAATNTANHFLPESTSQTLINAHKEYTTRYALRDYLAQSLGPQAHFSATIHGDLDTFHQDLNHQLILRLDALLSGIFKHK